MMNLWHNPPGAWWIVTRPDGLSFARSTKDSSLVAWKNRGKPLSLLAAARIADKYPGTKIIAANEKARTAERNQEWVRNIFRMAGVLD